MNRDTATSFHTTKSPKELTDSLIAALEDYGYSCFAYGLISTSPSAVIGEYIALNNVESDWMQHYFEHDLHKHDVLAAHCMVNSSPYRWTDMYAHAKQKRFTNEQTRVAYSARDAGLHIGVTIPLQQVGAYRAGISLVCDSAVSAKEHDRHFNAHERELIELVDTFHACMDLRRLSLDYYQPSGREIEALKWLSLGLHEKQIADRLGTSLSTVEKQVRSAKRRLHSATSTQAVAKAVMLGMIH